MAKDATPARPLSPHLQIWRFTAPMAASITHRGTGVVLYGGTVLLVCWLVALELHPPGFERIAAFANSAVGLIIIAGYVWALSFHLLNGLRHLYWDSGRGLAMRTVRIMSWAIYAAATALAAIVMWAGFFSGPA